MKQVFLKSLELAVPQVALGTVEMGLPYGFGVDGNLEKPTFEQAERLLNAALDLGICFIDTARAYGDSEEIIGRCLDGRRSRLVLATKATIRFDGASDAEIAKQLVDSVEQSLRLLRTDHVDWLMLHSANVSDVGQVSRLFDVVERLRQKGSIRAFGASIYFDALESSLQQPDFACLQIAASAIDRRAERAVAEEFAEQKDFIVRSVLLRGALTQRYKSLPQSMKPLADQIARLDEVANQAGMSLTELAYRYAADFDGLILVGTASIAELEQAIGFIERGALSVDVRSAIRSMGELDDRFLNPARWPKTDAPGVSPAN